MLRNEVLLKAVVVWFHSVCLTTGVLFAAPSPEARAAGSNPAPAAQRYHKLVPPESIEAGGARIEVQAPLDTVRAVVNDFNHYSSFLKRYKNGRLQLQISARLVGHSGDKKDVYLEVPILKGSAKVWGLLRFEPIKVVNGEEILEGKLVKGNVARLDARWRMRKIDEQRTNADLELLIVPQVPVPGSVITGELEFVADVAVTGTRDESERRKNGG
jgi:hypothetical protein